MDNVKFLKISMSIMCVALGSVWNEPILLGGGMLLILLWIKFGFSKGDEQK